ncbi:MAG: G1 family glutamic endopeptidase, partial [Gaiellaceae bacterium]
MRLRGAALVLILFAAVLFPLPGSTHVPAYPSQHPVFARLPTTGGHPIEHRHQRLGRSSSGSMATLETSANWAGYDATGGGFTSVTASWAEPAIQPSDSAEPYAVFWVGLDGDGSSTVEQTGTAAYSEGGNVYYYAWYEMYPAEAVLISGMTVSPGDEMTGTVTST